MSPGEQAAQAARHSYEALYHGHPETFLNARLSASAMPQDYRQALLDNYLQHVTQVNDQRRGVQRVEAVRAVEDTTLGVMQTFLRLTYGDGGSEVIVVPMEEHSGQWMLK